MTRHRARVNIFVGNKQLIRTYPASRRNGEPC